VESGPAALERCEQRIRDAEARFTRFLPDSELAGLNASDGRYLPVSPEMFAMLEAAIWAFAESDGLVNAAVLPALAAAGYDRPFRHGLTEPSVLYPIQLPPLPQVLLLDRATRSAALAPGAVLLGAALGMAFLEGRGVTYAAVPAEGAETGAGPAELPAAA